MDLQISPQLRQALLICALALLSLKLLASVPQEAPQPAPAPVVDRSINIGSQNDVCIGWCPR